MTRALRLAEHYGFNTMAMFVRQHRQWQPSPILTEAIARDFRDLRKRLGVGPVVAHGSYLVNLAAGGEIHEKSIEATLDELTRCGMLGIEYLNIHPGSHANRDEGARLVADALTRIVAACPHKRPKILLETMAGQGHSLGSTFEELAAILEQCRPAGRFGVCLDTCHVFAAGYDIRTPDGYAGTMAAFDRAIGLARLKAIHVNDSIKGLGSRVDRHTHIGHGQIGLAGFVNFVNDPRLSDVPLILETPKEQTEDGRDWDAVNAQTLREIVCH